MQRSRFVMIAVCSILGAAHAAAAQEITNPALNDIVNAVRSLCHAPDRQGEGWSVELGASGGAVIKLLDLKAEARFSKEEWNGIKDYLEDRPDMRDCVRDLTPQFLERFSAEPSKRSSAELYIDLLNFGADLALIVSNCACSSGIPSLSLYPVERDPLEMKLNTCSVGDYSDRRKIEGNSRTLDLDDKLRSIAASLGLAPHTENIIFPVEFAVYKVAIPNIYRDSPKPKTLKHYSDQIKSRLGKKSFGLGVLVYEYNMYLFTKMSMNRALSSRPRKFRSLRRTPEHELRKIRQQFSQLPSYYEGIRRCASYRLDEIRVKIEGNLLSMNLGNVFDEIMSISVSLDRPSGHSFLLRSIPYIERGIRQRYGS